MGLYEQLIDLPCQVRKDGSIADLVQKNFENRLSMDRRSRDYYYLTDLCNPVHTYWARKRNDVQRSREVANKLALGNRLHQRAFSWMREIPGYVCEETTLDGAYMQIERVIGKYDMKWKDSIVEFKTKPSKVIDVETVFAKYPQDLEQLCFYAALSPMELKEHYLVFQLDHGPFDMTVFRLEIKNHGAIRNIIRQRRDRLDNALRNSNPSDLGRCRYLEAGCDFERARICGCGSAQELSLKQLQESISLNRDPGKEDELAHFMAKEEKLTGNDLYRPLNLFKPRAYYVENLHGISESYQSDPLETAYRDALEKAVSRTDSLKVLPSELTHKKNNLLNLPIVRTWRWIAIRDSRSGGDQRTIVPVLVKVTRGEKPLRDMPDYYKAELTIARIVSKSQAGAVVVVYPRANDTIQAFMMSSDLSTLGEGERILRKAISSLRMAIEKHSIDNLDVCPSWAKPSYCGSCPESCTKLVHG